MHMPNFHRIVWFHSAAFERRFRDGGAELVWGQALLSLVGGTKTLRAAAVSPFSRAVDRSFGVALFATI